MHVMKRLGISIQTRDLFDGMIASWLCNENTPNGLKPNTKDILGVDQSKISNVFDSVTKEEKKDNGLKANSSPTFDLVRVLKGAPYAMDDSFYTWELYLFFLDELEREGMTNNYFKVYPDFLRALFEMEETGVSLDREKLEAMQAEMQEDLDKLQYELLSLAGVNLKLGRTQQLAELLFSYSDSKNPNIHIIKNSFGFPVQSKTPKGAPQSSTAVLKLIAKNEYTNKRKKEGVEFCKKLVAYKKLIKLKNAFVDGLIELSSLYKDEKVHPSFNIIGTDSGRISCSKPNLQQLPKAEDDDKYQIRSLFIGSPYAVTPDGVIFDSITDPKLLKRKDEGEFITYKRKKILALDYKNLEMVLLAHFSQDPNLLKCFNEGHDSHGDTAVNMFKLDCTADECKKKYPHLRQVGKVLNFGLMYGMGAETLCEQLEANGINMNDPELLAKEGCKNGAKLAQKYQDMYFEAYKGVAGFIRGQKKLAHRQEYVTTITGRKRRLTNINGRDFKQASYEERLSVNSSIQGSAGDVTMNAQNRVIKCPRLRELHCNMIIQIHDELVFECAEEYLEEVTPLIKHYMEFPFGDNKRLLNIDLVAEHDFGDSYQEAK